MSRFLALAFLCLTACGGGKDDPAQLPKCEAPVNGTNVTMRKVGSVVGGAMLATAPPGDLRLFVIEQRGAIRIFTPDTPAMVSALLPDPFLDISQDSGGPVLAGGEQGLLGLAFHPKYKENGLFFVFYTTRVGGNGLRDVVARCSVSAANPDRADAASCVEILSIPDFAGNHNGGMIEFGAKDSYLYIGTGDGGGAGDPQRTGQDKSSLLGKILRIDVDKKAAGKEYGIPSDNPFASGGGAPEVFILGLRNPWRFSFDRETGDLWIGDVGQGVIEELTVLRPAQQNGANLGWSIFEGNGCCMTQGDRCSQASPQVACDNAGMIFPQDSRTHGDGWISIIAGQTYRGTCYPDIVGWHFYTDYGKGGLVKARLVPGGDQLEIVDLTGSFPGNPASLHADARGELFMTTTAGDVYHLEAGP
jgi:glucose/arabinose dehydrogenase